MSFTVSFLHIYGQGREGILKNNKKILIALSLIIFGTLCLFLNINIIKGHWALLFIGLILFCIYIFIGGPQFEDNLSIILAGSHLLVLWLFYFLKSINLIEHNGFLLIFLSFAYYMVSIIHRVPGRPIQLWPILTGTLFLLLGFCWVLAFAIWPIFFIFLGLIMLLRN